MSARNNQFVDRFGRKITVTKRGAFYEARYQQRTAFGETPKHATKKLCRALRASDFGVPPGAGRGKG
jgi:hypothetical protein